MRHSHTTPTLSLHQLQKHLANSFKDHFCHLAGHLVLHSATSHSITRLCTSSRLGRPARHHSVLHVFTTRPPRASPLGCARLHHSSAPRVSTRLCASSPLGRPAHRHLVLHVFTTRPPRAAPLGFDTSSPLSRPAHRHSVIHVLAPRPPRASPSVGHVFTSTPPARERLSYSYGQTSYHTL